ncbi:DNA primase [Thermovibrio sp.]
MGSSGVPRSFIEDLLSKVDIVDVVSRYINLKQVGRNFTALCPFHPEKTPSFVVSPEKQIFKCFGCGVGGNAITFVEKYEGLSFFEAVKRVAEIAGVDLPSDFKREGVAKVEEEGFKAAKFFNSHLSKVLDYLNSRGITEETANRFLLGYAPKGYLSKLSISKDSLKALGLVSSSGKEFFSQRLIIPIFNHSGGVVAFAGRLLGEGTPKYINSPESETFKKSSLLYGFYQSKEEVLKKREVVVVEGYFDVISLHQIGIKRAVAPMGTSLTESHARFLKRYSQKPVLMFDGDSAGIKATIRSAGIFFKFGCEPLVVQLPQGEDPDSMTKSSPQLLISLLDSPQPFIDWALKFISHCEDSMKLEFLKLLAQAISQLEAVNPIIFKEYVSLLSAEFGIDERWVKLQAPVYRRREEVKEELPIPYHEKVFLKALLEGNLKLPVEISPTVFVSEKIGKLYTVITKGAVLEPTSLQLEYPEEASLISELLLMEVSEEDVLSAMCKVLAKELERRLKRVKGFNEKMRLKKLIFSLKRGDFGAVSQIQIN